MCICNTFPVFTGKGEANVPAESVSEQEEIISENSVNLSLENLSVNKSVDISSVNSSESENPKRKVSTGVGCSPIEIISGENVASESKPKSNSNQDKIMVTTSTGTSPPPQSISTQVLRTRSTLVFFLTGVCFQTYEDVPPVDPNKSPRASSRSSRRRDLKRSQSLKSAQKRGSEWSLHRSSSRHSFTTDSQVSY